MKTKITSLIAVFIITINAVHGQDDTLITNAVDRKIAFLQNECLLVSEKRAQDIIGEALFFGSVDVLHLFTDNNIEYFSEFKNKVKNPLPIPFSEEELKSARKRGMMLVLQLDLTMDEMNKLFIHSDKKSLFANPKDYESSEFISFIKTDYFKNHRPMYGWRLVDRDIFPGSSEKRTNTEKLQLLVDYANANNVHASIESPAEVFYRLAVFFKKNKVRWMNENFALTTVSVSKGNFVAIGEFDGYPPFGIKIIELSSKNMLLDLGYVFSRKF